MDSTIFEGQFWLPDKKNEKIFGSLNISLLTGEIILYLTAPIDANNNNGDKYELIYGFSTKGKLLSLQGCLVNESPNCFPGLKTQKISVEMTYVVPSFNDMSCKYYEPSTKIDKILVGFTYLNDWFDIPFFNLNVDRTSDDRKSFRITHTQPEEHHAAIKIDDICIKLKSKYGFGELGAHFANSSKIIKKHYFETALEIEINKALSFDEWFDLILNPIRELIILGTLMPNWVSTLSIIQRSADQDTYIKVYSQKIICKRIKQKIKRHEMLFTFDTIKNDFNDILNKWFAVQDKAKYLLGAFFSTIQSRDMYLEHHFLTLAQVGEAYHRVFDYSKKIKDIDKKGQEIWRDPYFKERFEELLNSANSEIISRIIPDKQYFLNVIKDNRNALSHLDTAKKRFVANPKELLTTLHQLNALICILLLNSLGISCKNILPNFYRYN